MDFGLEGGVPGTLYPVDQWAEEGTASEASVTPKPQGSVAEAALAPARGSEQVPTGAGRTVAPAAPAGWGSAGQTLEPLLWGTLEEVQRPSTVASDKGIGHLGLS